MKPETIRGNPFRCSFGKRIWIVVVCCAVAGQPLYPQTGHKPRTLPGEYISRANFFSKDHFLSGSIFQDTLFSDTATDPSDDATANQRTAFSEVDHTRLAIVGGGLVALVAGIHIYQQNGWWRDNRAPFHFREDLNYGVWVDKIGHFYGATVGTFIARKAYEWANVSDEGALWMGSGTAFLFQTYIELEDGFSKWGFDRVDYIANLVGTAWPVARYYSPFLQKFDFKFSYHPSPLLGTNPGGTGFQGQKHLIFDDYEGQTLWLSIKVHDFLPGAVQEYWPGFLCVALGYGARDITSPDAYPVLFLALDYDMTRIIPDDTWFLRTLGEALNFIHLPAPAVRISPSAIWYGLYF